MKKSPSYLLFCLLGLFYGKISAQMAVSEVNLQINSIMEIEVSHPIVAIDMNQVSHFTGGSTTGLLPDHFVVTATPDYQVSVRTLSSNFFYAGVETDLPVNTVQLETQLGSSDPSLGNLPGGIVLEPAVTLDPTPSVLLNSTNLSVRQGFDVQYSIPANQTFNYLNREPGDYSVTVEFTVIAN